MGEGAQTPIAIGDTVLLKWETPSGMVRKVRGRVVGLSPKRGVQVNYLHFSGERGGGFSMESRTIWKPIACATKVEPGEGDKLTPSQTIGALVRAMAGEKPDHG